MKVKNQVVTDKYAIYNGDSCELMTAFEDNYIGYSLHSPPFEGLYKFSDSPRDVSNSEGESFWNHYGFIISELLRITQKGRLASVHCMQLPTSKGRDGFIGMRDFRGECIREFQKRGWLLHSEVCIWKDPVVAMQRTKSIRLLHNQVCKDSAISGQGLADYIVTFRKPGDNENPISGQFDHYVGAESNNPESIESRMDRMSKEDAEKWYSVDVWQRYASPVWTDINQTRTLQYQTARDEKDELHISPLQLDVIERCIHLWSNPKDRVFTPFLGIGSEVYGACKQDRYGIGIELKDSYFNQCVQNLKELETNQLDMAI